MKFSVSNIAWPANQRDSAYALLQECGVTGLEIAPGLFFPHAASPYYPSDTELASELAALRDAGLELVSMQSLLFGTNDATLFAADSARERLDKVLSGAINLAQRLAIPVLVFGSPRQRRIPPHMDPASAEIIALDFFRRVGDRAHAANTQIAIEAISAVYGNNFLNKAEEADAFVKRVDHPGIVLNFDIGELHLDEDFDRIEQIAGRAADRIGHVHISEPHFAPAPADIGQATRMLRALNDAGYARWYSIEMKATKFPLQDLRGSIERLMLASETLQVTHANR